MRILGYGEDALTLWAMKNRLGEILDQVGDKTPPEKCDVLFRPSFGRNGGPNRSEFGEFDFIILSKSSVYLGESKWDGSSEHLRNGALLLRDEQRLRHRVFRFYVSQWFRRSHQNWREFLKFARPELERRKILKRLPGEHTLLAQNLQTVLGLIKRRCSPRPRVRDVLLYLHDGLTGDRRPSRGSGFKLVCVDYSAGAKDGFVRLK